MQGGRGDYGGGGGRGGFRGGPPPRRFGPPPHIEGDPNEYHLSKLMSLILRHAPDKFGLQLDDNGYVPLEELASAIKEKCPYATPDFIKKFVATPQGSRRFVIDEDCVAARYGHSIPITIDLQPAEPPEFLYLGTVPRSKSIIMSEGLKPVDRQFVHLSTTEEEANKIGQHKARDPMILRIATKKAREAGIEFFHAGHLYLCRAVPASALEVIR